MRHKMMINEFIGRCSSNKGSELAYTPRAWRRRSTHLGFSLGAPVPSRCPVLDTLLPLNQDASCGVILDPRFTSEGRIQAFWKRRAGSSCPPSPPGGSMLKLGAGLGLVQEIGWWNLLGL